MNTRTATEVRFVIATDVELKILPLNSRQNIAEIYFRYQISGIFSGMASVSEISREWTFLSNHGHVLVHLSRYPDSRVRDIADTVGITERSAQAILADLEESGYVTITRIGRRNSYKVNTGLKFRHPSEASKPISSLLKIFT
jgi:hypothetical protein